MRSHERVHRARRIGPALALVLIAALVTACGAAGRPAHRAADPSAAGSSTQAPRSGPGFLGDRASLTVVPDDDVPHGCKWIPSTASLECRANAVIRNMYVKGGVDAYAGITIVNSVIAATRTNWLLVNLRARGGACTVKQSTLTYDNDGKMPAGFTTWGVGGINDMNGCRGVFTDNDISGTPDGIDTGAANTVIEGNHVHDLATVGAYPHNTHNDAVQLFGCSKCTITGNRFDVGWDGTHQNSCFFASDGSAGNDIVFSHNYLSGGGYAFRNIIATNMTVTDNTFHSVPRQYGLTLTGPAASFAQWSGNVTTTGQKVAAPKR